MMPSYSVIRPARPDEYDEIARVWMESWVSTGLDIASTSLLEKLRARVRREIEGGWSLYVADDEGAIAAVLALHLPNKNLDQIFVAPQYQGPLLGRKLLAFTRTQLPDEIWLRCALKNEKAWRWWSDSNIRPPSRQPRKRMLESKDHQKKYVSSGVSDLTFASGLAAR